MDKKYRIELDTSLNAAKNASLLYEKAKELERKVQVIDEKIKELSNKLEKLEKNVGFEIKEVLRIKKKRKWYEKFRWFYSSTGKLIIGGKDATTNEILMNKIITNPNKIVFHADIAGSPFFAVYDEEDEISLKEAAEAAGIFSKAWKLGLGSISVYAAKREQYSKKAPAGEYIKKGSFMVYGKKEYYTVELKAAIGIFEIEEEIKPMCGPISAVKANCKKYVIIEPQGIEKGKASKLLSKILNIDQNEIAMVLPSGNIRIEKMD